MARTKRTAKRTGKRGGKPNKKKTRSGGFSVPPPLILILVSAAVLSFFYLWIHGRCEALGLRIQELERTMEQVHNQVLNEQSKWSAMKSLPSVRRALDKYNIKMDWPKKHKVIHVRYPVKDQEKPTLGS